MDDDEVTGERIAPISLVGDPVVGRAEAFTEDTAELPALVDVAELIPDPDDRLVTPPDSGVGGWFARFRGVLGACALPLLAVGALCVAPMYVFEGRISDIGVAAPMLSDMAGGIGLLLLPLMWLSYFALAAVPIVLALAGVAAVLAGWGPQGDLPRFKTVWRTASPRVKPLWAWLAVLGFVPQVQRVIPVEAAGPKAAMLWLIFAAVVSAGLATFLGVLGGVVLFERGHGPRRALRLLAVLPGGVVAMLGLAGLALAVLPPVADESWGQIAGALVGVACALLWSVAAILAYAQGRRVVGLVTSARLRRELSA